MKHGIVILPEERWSQERRRWMRSEELGFDSAWTFDHLAWLSLADGPWYGTVPTLTAAALSTTTIALGTFVSTPNFRHPVPFAKELVTLDEMSGGRMIAGVGAGAVGFDSAVLGERELTRRERHERYVDFVRALDRLLRFEEPGSGGIDFSSTWYQAVKARMVGVPEQRPRMPIHLAANGPASLRFAAELGDGWITLGDWDAADPDAWWASVALATRRFEDALTETARDPGEVERVLNLDAGPVYSLSSLETFRDAVGRADELGFDHVVTHWPRAEGEFAGSESVLEEVAGDFARA